MSDDGSLDFVELIDHSRSASLFDVGAPDYTATLCISASGDIALWLARNSQIEVDDADFGNRNQEHEQLGPLPLIWRARIYEARTKKPTDKDRDAPL